MRALNIDYRCKLKDCPVLSGIGPANAAGYELPVHKILFPAPPIIASSVCLCDSCDSLGGYPLFTSRPCFGACWLTVVFDIEPKRPGKNSPCAVQQGLVRSATAWSGDNWSVYGLFGNRSEILDDVDPGRVVLHRVSNPLIKRHAINAWVHYRCYLSILSACRVLLLRPAAAEGDGLPDKEITFVGSEEQGE